MFLVLTQKSVSNRRADVSDRIRKWVAASVAVVACMTAIGAMAGTAQAATSGPCYGAPSRTCYPTMSQPWVAWTSPNSQGAQYWTIQAGTRVDQRCWTTGANRLGTSKWFYVISQRYPYTRGYVPANAVTQQITVGHC